MADKLDPYREALVVETATVWPEELAVMEAEERGRIEGLLHADPGQAAEMYYDRLPTGFCRRIVVTPADVERLKQ